MRAIFLVRHPIVTVWTQLMRGRSTSANVTLRLLRKHHMRWHNDAQVHASHWASMLTLDREHGDWSWRRYALWQRPHLLVRFEDLTDAMRRRLELRRVIDFVFGDVWTSPATARRLRCAVEQATQMYEQHREGTLRINRGLMRAALERTPPWLQGEAASNHSTADEIWKLVRAPAQMLNYERHGYHLLPGIGLK